jgi:hypothetical protein
MKRCKSPGTDKILTEVIQAGRNILRSEIKKLNSIWNNVTAAERINYCTYL